MNCPCLWAIFAIKKMKRSIIFASMAIASGLTLANVYNSIVDVPAWSNQVPGSIDTARQYFKVSNPGDFFRVFSPLNQALGLVALLLFWKRSSKVRWLLVSALVLYVIGEGLTFMYFYPRNDIMFFSNTANVETLRNTLNEWRSMNWVRSMVIAAGVICSATALHFTYFPQATRISGATSVRREKQAVSI